MDEAGFVGDAFGDAPSHAGIGHQTVRRRFQCNELSLAEPGLDEDVSVGDDGAGAGAVLGAFFEAPEFFAGRGIVAVVGFCAAGDEDGFSVQLCDEGGSEAFAIVAIAGGFAIAVEVFVVNGAVRFPNGLPGFLVEGGDELKVAAVEVHDEQVVPEDGAGACASEVVADKVGSLPENVTCARIECGGSWGAEGHVNNAIRCHGRG